MNTINIFGDDSMPKININADEEIIKKLDQICKYTKRNRTQMIHYLIEDEHRNLRYGGLFLMSECLICGETEKRLVKHHTDYEKDITVLLCDICHRNLHAGNIESDIPVPDPSLEKDKSVLELPISTMVTDCFDARVRKVPLSPNTQSATVIVPKSWKGYKVMVLLVGG